MYTLDVQLSKVFSSLEAPCDATSDHSEFNCIFTVTDFPPSAPMIEHNIFKLMPNLRF